MVPGRPIVQGNAHRIYTVREAERIAIAAGFEVVTRAVWATVDKRWRRPKEEPAPFGPHDPDYLSMVLAKRIG